MATQKSNIPALRFPEFKGEWSCKNLKDISNVYDGTHQTPDYTTDGVPFVSVENIYDLNATSKFISEDDFKRDFKNPPKIGDILMTRITAGIIGATNVIKDNKPLAYYVSLALIRPNQGIESNFLSLNISSNRFKRELHKRIIHVAFPKKINLGDIGNCEVIFPLLEEQKKIADFLMAVDQKIAQLTEKKSCLEQYKKGVMQRLFTQALRFHDTNGNPFPDWEEKKLGTLYSWVNTNNLSRDKLTYESGSVQNIHYGDIHTRFHKNFKQSQEVIPFIDGVTVDDFNKESFVKIGDLVIADASEDYADIGKAIEIVELNDIPLVAGLHTYIARPKKNALATGFSSYLFQTFFIRKQIMRLAQGISVLGISKGNLENISLLIPHIKEQQKIADFLTAIDAKITALGNQLTAAQDFKKSLLQKMFV